jgi:uncharacterized protein (TIGR03435 family)
MHYATKSTCAAFIAALLFIPFSQAQAPAQKPVFEAVSVKPDSEFRDSSISIDVNRYTATGTTLRRLILEAYNLRDFQLSNGLAWIDSDRWSVEAVAPAGITFTIIDYSHPERPTVASQMMQSMIESRFQFRYHYETKELPVYELTLAKNGPKMKPLTDGGSGGILFRFGGIETKGPFATFVYALSRQNLDRALIDKTNLSGSYDIKLQWNPNLTPGGDPSTSSDQPSIFTALQEQLGLKLESAKGPVRVLVIDNAQRPSEN